MMIRDGNGDKADDDGGDGDDEGQKQMSMKATLLFNLSDGFLSFLLSSYKLDAMIGESTCKCNW